MALLLTVLLAIGQDGLALDFKLQLVVWLWLTVLFGTFAEALAEGCGKAKATSLRATKAELTARRLKGNRPWPHHRQGLCRGDGTWRIRRQPCRSPRRLLYVDPPAGVDPFPLPDEDIV